MFSWLQWMPPERTSDGEPVDLVIGMLLPGDVDDNHRADIHLVTEMLADEGLRARLRNASRMSR